MNQELRAIVDHMKKELAQEVQKMNLANQTMEIDGIRYTLPLEGRSLDMVYYPAKTENGTDFEEKAPLLIGFYGGGFLFGGCAMNDYMWQALSNQLGVNVASIGYRKSPDHMWRDVLDDGYDASVYLKEHAEEFGFDPEHISVFGCSAGASLATRTALYAKQKDNLFFDNQILMYPFVDTATDPLEKGEGSLSGPIMYVFNEFHRTEEEARLTLVSPVFASIEELRGMPNTVIVLAENDCLRAEGQKYAELLAEAGVPMHMTCMEGMPHGFFESGFGVRGEELEFLGEAAISGIKDGTIPRKSAEAMEFIKRHLAESEAFYSEQNLAYVERPVNELHAGKGQVHDLIEAQIQDLLAKMTLEEKVGQLQQCGPSLVGAFEVSFEELLDMMFDGRISKEEFDRLMGGAKQDFHEDDIRAGRIGSFNGIGDAATANRLQKIAVEETRLGIPLIYGYDVIHGFRTVTPIPLAESCAWEPDLWERTARLAAKEATVAGVHMTFAPMVDVAKDARWGRVSEGAGEDVLLNGDYGAAKVRGFQGDDLTKEDAMAACVKHFAAYGAIEAGRDYNRVDMSLQKLWDEYLPSYKACIDAGARAVMPAFNDINGVPCSANEWLLRDVLRKEWGFDGMTVSDANAIAECVNHGIAVDQRDAARQCLQAGVDMDMTSNSYIAHIQELIESGELEESVLDESVADILRVKFELGLFEHPYRTNEEREAGAMLTEEARKLAREAAEKSFVLLKNEAVLPLAADTRLGIFGHLAADRGEMTGAWSIGANPDDCLSIIDACGQRGVKYQYLENQDLKNRIAEIAADSDVLIAAIGENKDESGEAASRASITLKDSDVQLVDMLLEAGKAEGKPVVVVLFNGRPLAIPQLAESADAILEAWHPGVEAGPAVLDVLFGDVNPSGKLTTTFPYASGQCPMYYAHMNTGRPGGKSKFTSKYLDTPLEPVYPFGYGLSYTTFEYNDLSVGKITEKECFRVTVTLKNTGNRAGEEIVQCYVQDVVGSRVRPVKELKGYQKIRLEAGEEQQVVFELPFEKLGFYNRELKYVVEPGEFRIFVGGNSRDVLEESVIL